MKEDKNLTYTEFRKRIGDVKHPEYWRSLDEAMRSDVFDDFMHDEFPRQAAALTSGVDRRDFMKYMGASVAMAGLVACNQPNEKIIPYLSLIHI